MGSGPDGKTRLAADRALSVPRCRGRLRIQTINIDRRVAAGEKIIGRKVGLTSAPMQKLLGVDEPDFGVLTDEMFVEDGDLISLSRLVQPRVEAELAFLMETDLAGPGVTTAGALRAIAGALPAVEIVDSRVADWKIKLVDTVADNASSGLLVVGGRMRKVEDLDLRLLGVVVSRHGEVIDTGAGAAALGNPARCVAWLANKLGSLGSGLKAGDIVLPGAVHKMVPVEPGDVFRADFAHLGGVTVRFSTRRREPRRPRSITPAEIAEILITGERERKEVPQISETYGDIDIAKAYAGAAGLRAVQTGRRGSTGRLQTRPDQPEQAAGDGRRLAAVWPGDQFDAVHLRRSDPVRSIHPSPGRIGDRLPDRPRRSRHRRRSPRCWPPPTWSTAPSTCSTPAIRASSSPCPTSSPTTPAPVPSTSDRSPGHPTNCSCTPLAAWSGSTARW